MESQAIQNAQLKHEVDEKTDHISAMQMTIERLQSDKPDSGNLIAEIENYKVAASRALSQNEDLKIQLEEIQKAFIQLVS